MTQETETPISDPQLDLKASRSHITGRALVAAIDWMRANKQLVVTSSDADVSTHLRLVLNRVVTAANVQYLRDSVDMPQREPAQVTVQKQLLTLTRATELLFFLLHASGVALSEEARADVATHLDAVRALAAELAS